MHTSAGTVARTRELDPTAGPAIDSPPAGGLTDVSVAVSGTETDVTWMVPQPGGDSAGQGFIARATAGATTLVPQVATPNENVQELLANPTTHGPDLVWIARPDGTGPGIPTSQLKTVVRAANAQ